MYLFRRITTLFWLKMVGSTLVITAFFVAYFYVLNHPYGPTFIMPLLAPDRWTPVLPWSAWIYFSLWVYICMPSSLMVRRNELGVYLMGATLLSALGISIFYFLPTAVPDWGIDWNAYPTLRFLKESDASGNACPSLHVGFAVYSGLWFARMLRIVELGRCWQVGNGLWGLLIIVSTMTTKQHVLVDVLCGALLGVLVCALNDWIVRATRMKAFRTNGAD